MSHYNLSSIFKATLYYDFSIHYFEVLYFLWETQSLDLYVNWYIFSTEKFVSFGKVA